MREEVCPQRPLVQTHQSPPLPTKQPDSSLCELTPSSKRLGSLGILPTLGSPSYRQWVRGIRARVHVSTLNTIVSVREGLSFSALCACPKLLCRRKPTLQSAAGALVCCSVVISCHSTRLDKPVSFTLDYVMGLCVCAGWTYKHLPFSFWRAAASRTDLVFTQ